MTPYCNYNYAILPTFSFSFNLFVLFFTYSIFSFNGTVLGILNCTYFVEFYIKSRGKAMENCPWVDFFYCIVSNLDNLRLVFTTVEPRLTTTPLIRPSRYCDHFFVARTKAHSFSYLTIPLIRLPRCYDQRPPLGVLSRYVLYKITPLIRPVKMLGGAAE